MTFVTRVLICDNRRRFIWSVRGQIRMVPQTTLGGVVKIRMAIRAVTMAAMAAGVIVATPVLAAAADGTPNYGSNTPPAPGLPVTGFPVGTFVLVGLALLLVGAVLAVATRKRAERH
jgi:hypothetical protein